MKLLILGCNGQLGRCLSDQLVNTDYQVVYTSRTEIDISDFQATKEKICEISPHVVINATAYTAVDQAEENHEIADIVNHLAVLNIAEVCTKLGSWLVHVSTDYVFDGESTEPYKESSETAPQGVYGVTKLKGEIAIQASGCLHLIIRTAWVFSEYGNNFLKTMLRLGAQRDELNVVGDQVGCPTYAQDIAKVIVEALACIKLKKCASGIYHYCGDVPCSWYDFANSIFYEAKTLGFRIPKTVNSIDTDSYPTLASRPSFSVLDSSKIKIAFGVEASNWNDGVTESLKRIRKFT